jgi:anti-sigma factor RsiW
MNCSEIQRGVYVYLDGEFAAPEAEALEAHLGACESCQTLVRREAAFLQGFRESLATPATPAGLRERVEATLAVTPLPEGAGSAQGYRPRTYRLGWAGIPAAAALTLALLILLPGAPADAEVDSEITHAVSAHHRHFPSEVAGSPGQVREYLQRSVSFAVEAPITPGPKVKLLGARLTQVQGEPAVVYHYQVEGQRISVLQSPTRRPVRQARKRRGHVHHRVHHHQGYAVVTYETRGVTHAVVSTMDEEQLVRLVPTTLVRRSKGAQDETPFF